MQKVVGSSPIIRFPQRKAGQWLSARLCSGFRIRTTMYALQRSRGTDGSVVSVDGRDWFVLMSVPPQAAEHRRRLICVRADAF